MNLFLHILFTLGVLFAIDAFPQVPYDYIPLGREARRHDEEPTDLAGHPSDVALNYERLYPSRRKWVDHNFQLHIRE